MNIADLLKAKKTVVFTLDDDNHEVELRSPTAAIAKDLRAKFYAIGQKANSQKANADLANKFEEVLAEVVMACFVEGTSEANLDSDTVRLFLLRIGGDKSEVVRTAMEFCGIPLEVPNEKEHQESDPTAF